MEFLYLSLHQLVQLLKICHNYSNALSRSFIKVCRGQMAKTHVPKEPLKDSDREIIFVFICLYFLISLLLLHNMVQ